MIEQIRVDGFEPTEIASGGTIRVRLEYSANEDGFIVVNEPPNFDATPGRIEIRKGSDLRATAEIRVTRQPAFQGRECLILFTLGLASHTILVKVQ
jgi:hypothetical protein